MTKNVQVHIIGTQYIDGIEDKTEIKGLGIYYEKNGKHYCFYEHSDPADKTVYKKTIKFDSCQVEMSDRGETASMMKFDVNNDHSTEYKTVMGLMNIDINTKAYKHSILDNMIDIDIDYELTFNENITSGHRVSIRIESIG